MIDNNEVYYKIGMRIRKKREEKGYSLQELETLTGISKSSLQRYEAGNTKKIPIEAFPRLSEALGVSRWYLMGWNDQEEEKVSPLVVRKPLASNPLSSNLAYSLKDSGTSVFSYEKRQVSSDFVFIAPDNNLERLRIKEGDVVFIKTDAQYKDEDIVLISQNGTLSLKQVFYEFLDYWTFVGNISSRPISSHNLEGDGIKIVGKAVAFQSEI